MLKFVAEFLTVRHSEVEKLEIVLFASDIDKAEERAIEIVKKVSEDLQIDSLYEL